MCISLTNSLLNNFKGSMQLFYNIQSTKRLNMQKKYKKLTKYTHVFRKPCTIVFSNDWNFPTIIPGCTKTQSLRNDQRQTILAACITQISLNYIAEDVKSSIYYLRYPKRDGNSRGGWRGGGVTSLLNCSAWQLKDQDQDQDQDQVGYQDHPVNN